MAHICVNSLASSYKDKVTALQIKAVFFCNPGSHFWQSEKQQHLLCSI